MEYFKFPICGSILCTMLFFSTVCFSLRNTRSFSARHFVQPSRDGRRCHDFCSMIPGLCRNGGSCKIDEGTCVGKCVCTAGWSGQWCKDPVSNTDADMQDLKTLHESLDIDRNETNNEVFPIVKTIAANKIEMDITTVVSKIAKKNSLFFHISKSTMNPSGNFTSSLENKSKASVYDVESKEICEKGCSNGKCIKVDDLYKCKHVVNVSDNSVLKVCGPGFECDHGVCDMKELERNSYKCICENNYVGQFCTLKCPYDCGEHGFCDYSVANKEYKCFCQWNYTGQNCSKFVPEDLKDDYVQENLLFHWYVVGGCATLVVLVLTSLFLAAYFMWRKRLVFILKIVHYFQQCEDDDGKQYDAFVSYKSCPRDEKFVIQQLFPKLEEEFKFKLCLHFRDFIPGEAIANNIVKAIEGSRRTIMILSQDYVQSEWCRLEYQTAQHEMLKLKHKIIPIVLEDISVIKTLDRNLNSILNSVTYLEWPGQDNIRKLDGFWKRLELSLPKKSTSISKTTPSSSSNSSNGCDALSFEVTSSRKLPSSVPPLGSTSISAIASSENIECSTLHPSNRVKTKDFKYFMEKLINNKFFKRQDSNGSEADLVDHETLASQSSCGSVSESCITESSDHESMCSTPETPNSYLSECSDNRQFNACFENCSIDEVTEVSSERKWKELNSSTYEKKICDDKHYENCLKIKPKRESSIDSNQSKEYSNMAYRSEVRDDCRYCRYILQYSDNNRVRISNIEGSNKVKIQKVPMNIKSCAYCNRVMVKSSLYRGSMKHRKNVENLYIMRQNSVDSLQRSYKNSNNCLYISSTPVKVACNDKESHDQIISDFGNI